jgi:methyl-accepting chemotaxis protein
MRMLNVTSYGLETCLQISRAQLQAININIRELHTSIDNASLVITDTAHHVQTIVEILPDIGNQVQGVYQEVPKLAAGIEAIQEHLRVSQPLMSQNS